jgi:hypothetical protein
MQLATVAFCVIVLVAGFRCWSVTSAADTNQTKRNVRALS